MYIVLLKRRFTDNDDMERDTMYINDNIVTITESYGHWAVGTRQSYHFLLEFSWGILKPERVKPGSIERPMGYDAYFYSLHDLRTENCS